MSSNEQIVEVADLYHELTPETVASFVRQAQRHLVRVDEVRFTPSPLKAWTWQGYAKGVAR